MGGNHRATLLGNSYGRAALVPYSSDLREPLQTGGQLFQVQWLGQYVVGSRLADGFFDLGESVGRHHDDVGLS